MKSLVFIFLLVHFFSFSQNEEWKVIDDFHIDLGLGYGSYLGVQYIGDPKGGSGSYVHRGFSYLSLPHLGINYRNKYFKADVGSRFLIGWYPNDYSTDFLKNKVLLEASLSGNLISIFKKDHLRKIYFGPIVGYSQSARRKYDDYPALILGGEFYYNIFHIRFSHFNFLEPLHQGKSHLSAEDKVWFIDFGLSFSTGMGRNKFKPKKRIIDKFHLDISIGAGVSKGKQSYYQSNTADYFDYKFTNLTYPKFGINYRNQFLKIELSAKYFRRKSYLPFIEDEFTSFLMSEPYDYMAKRFLSEISISGNVLPLFKKHNFPNLYLGPLLGYSKSTYDIPAVLLGGEFYYRFLHLRFSNYQFLEPLGFSFHPTKKDRAWFIDFGISFSTKMFQKK